MIWFIFLIILLSLLFDQSGEVNELERKVNELEDKELFNEKSPSYEEIAEETGFRF